MNIDILKLYDDAIIPTRGSEYAAGYDLYAYTFNDTIKIMPNETKKIRTGISMAIPDGFFGAIFARSGIAVKRGLRPANCVGVIDSDYRGEIIVALTNDTDIEQTVLPNERIAQIVIMPYLQVKFNEVDKLSDTKRGDGGFGSTGTVEIEGQMSIEDYLK